MPGSPVERCRQRHDRRVLDAVREAMVAEHAAQCRRDVVSVALQVPALADEREPVAVLDVDGRNLAGERLRRDGRNLAHRRHDVVGTDRGERAHRLELLELVGKELGG